MPLKLLSLVLFLSTSSAFSWDQLENTNIPGLDFQRVPNIDASQCEAACISDPQCNAYTWVPVSERHAEQACWLKWGISSINESAGLVSGVRPAALTGTSFVSLPNRNLGGPDYRRRLRITPADCAAGCENDIECSAYTWVPLQSNTRIGYCWMKGALTQSNGPTNISGFISGARPFRARIPNVPPPSNTQPIADILSSAPPARTGPPERHVFVVGPSTEAERFIGRGSRLDANAFRARGHQVTEMRSVGADQVLNRLTALILNAPENSQVLVDLECHGSTAPADHPEQHNCHLGNDYLDWRTHLTAAHLLRMGEIARERHIRFGIIDTSCFGGNTVRAFEAQPQTCVVSVTAHNNLGVGGSLTPGDIRNRNNENLNDLARSMSPRIASFTRSVPHMSTAFISGCHQPWMDLHGGLANGYLSQSEWNGRRWAPWREVSSFRGDKGNNRIQRYTDESCEGIVEATRAHALLEAYLSTHSVVLEERFTHEFAAMKRRYTAAGLRVPASITSYAALMSHIDRLIEQIYTHRDVQYSLLERFNALPTSNSSALTSLRQEILREHTRLLGVYTSLSPLLSIAQELDCSTRESTCSNMSL